MTFGAEDDVKTQLGYGAAILLAVMVVPLGMARGQGYAPAEAVAKMTVADGFEVDLVAAEPLVRQPVAIDVDDRGRLWVLQYLQYPNPAGLERVKVDRYSRTTYDRVPKPPPYGPLGADRLTILTDTDGDGICDTAKDFTTGLNLSTGFAFGHGGVFVLQVPYLLFYPDRDRDDVPDADPKVLLSGFGMEDSSSLANSLTWGPDGWLYGTQGTNITANIRGIQFEQGVWRYHPVSDRFELFCEGGGNSWGLDFDARGNLLYATNYGGYLMHHAIEGANYEKSFAKHGELHNRFAFGFFPHVPHDRFEGGHVTVGGFVYQGDAFPDSYRGRYISVDTLGHAVRVNDIHPDGATFRTTTGSTLVVANDTWFAPSDSVMGPNGSVYFCDWHDKRTAHPDPDAEWDRSNGRVYRLRYGEATTAAHLDPNDLTSAELVDWLTSRNEWRVRRARRVLAERRDPGVVDTLNEMLGDTDVSRARQALWTLAAMGAYDGDVPVELLSHPDDVVRAWAVRFVGDWQAGDQSDRSVPISRPLGERLLAMARDDTSPLVVSQLAATAQRVPATLALGIVRAISNRDEWLADRYIPLLVWWALERHAMSARVAVLDVFASDDAWQSRFVREVLLGRLMRRYAGDGSDDALAACARLMHSASGESARRLMLAELDAGLKMLGQERLPGLPLGAAFADIAIVEDRAPTESGRLTIVPPELADVLDGLWKDDTTDPLLVRLFMRLGSPSVEARAMAVASDRSAKPQTRLAMLEALGELGDDSCAAAVWDVVASDATDSIRLAALDVLRRFSDERTTEQMVAMYDELNEPLRSRVREVLLGRTASARTFLAEVDRGAILPDEVTINELRRLALHDDQVIDAMVRKHWGSIRAGTPEEKLAEIRRLSNDLRAGSGDVDRGRELFTKHCATCHRLFDDGLAVGPELTTANRGDLMFLLTSMVDPSAQVRKEFMRYNVLSDDGRIATGLLVEDSDAAVTLLTEKNERVTIARDEIEQIEPSQLSLMPEDILKPLRPQQVRDLFAYMQSQTKG